MKGPMNSSIQMAPFLKHPDTKPSTRKKIKVMQSLIELFKVANVKIYQWNFLELAALKHFTKKAMTRFLRGASSTKPSSSKQLRK